MDSWPLSMTLKSRPWVRLVWKKCLVSTVQCDDLNFLLNDDLNFLLKDDLNFLMEWWFEVSFESLQRANVFSFIRPADFNSFGDQSQISKDMVRALGFCFTLLYLAMLTSAKDSNRDGKCNYIKLNYCKKGFFSSSIYLPETF